MEQNRRYLCSVVIPTKNGGDLFLDVLQGLQQQTCRDAMQLIIVDSGSTDDTVMHAERAGAIVHRIPPEQFNHGATRDLGISLAESDKIVLMVQDAVPFDHYLIERLVAALDAPGVAAAYSRQLPRPTADVLTKRNLNEWLTGRVDRTVRTIQNLSAYEALSAQEKYFTCNFDNVCSATNRSVWENIKFGPVSIGEDVDWAERVLKAGYAIVYEPSAVVVHSHERSLLYEYKRAYFCHRKLFQQFKLRLIPNAKTVIIWWVRSSVRDMLYVLKNEKHLPAKLSLAVKSVALNFLLAIGQYRGAKDELAGRERRIEGV